MTYSIVEMSSGKHLASRVPEAFVRGWLMCCKRDPTTELDDYQVFTYGSLTGERISNERASHWLSEHTTDPDAQTN